MSSYTLSATVAEPFPIAVERVRAALAEAGFGVITEIDMAGTLNAKLDVEIPPQLILGACRPDLAHQAIEADPSVAALLPCNVVVRTVDDHNTVVETFDPAFLTGLTDDDAVRAVATDARDRLVTMLDSLAKDI